MINDKCRDKAGVNKYSFSLCFFYELVSDLCVVIKSMIATVCNSTFICDQ